MYSKYIHKQHEYKNMKNASTSEIRKQKEHTQITHTQNTERIHPQHKYMNSMIYT
jgi:hypothetical protein